MSAMIEADAKATGRLDAAAFGEIQRLLAGNELNRLPSWVEETRRKGSQAVTWVLSGGGALAPIHVGVIGALLEGGVPFNYCIGTSAGAIGTLVASRAQTLEAWLHAKRLGETVNWSVLARRDYLRHGGLFNLHNLGEYMTYHAQEMQDLSPGLDPAPAAFVTTDITGFPNRNLHVHFEPRNGTPIGKLVQASCSVPFVFSPTTIGGQWLWDGGAIPRSGYEPVDVVDVLTPEAMTISVRLAYHNDENFMPQCDPHIRIQPCDRLRHDLLEQAHFDPNDVYLGYLEGFAALERIHQAMANRGIAQSWKPGFGGSLLPYFSQRQIV